MSSDRPENAPPQADDTAPGDAPRDPAPASEANAAADATPAASPDGPELTPALLKSAYNAFKKRWKLTRLDHESRIGKGPMSSGQKSSIGGILPPDQFPKVVWEELARQGRIKYIGQGFYSM